MPTATTYAAPETHSYYTFNKKKSTCEDCCYIGSHEADDKSGADGGDLGQAVYEQQEVQALDEQDEGLPAHDKRKQAGLGLP